MSGTTTFHRNPRCRQASLARLLRTSSTHPQRGRRPDSSSTSAFAPHWFQQHWHYSGFAPHRTQQGVGAGRSCKAEGCRKAIRPLPWRYRAGTAADRSSPATKRTSRRLVRTRLRKGCGAEKHKTGRNKSFVHQTDLLDGLVGWSACCLGRSWCF